MAEYVAIRECFYGAVLYREGQRATFPDGEAVPHHFRIDEPAELEEAVAAEMSPPDEAPPADKPRSQRPVLRRKRPAKRTKARVATTKIEPAPDMQAGA